MLDLRSTTNKQLKRSGKFVNQNGINKKRRYFGRNNNSGRF